jgi:hypothetical protein
MQPDFHNEYARGTTCSTGGECAMWRIFASLFWPAGKEVSGRFFATLGSSAASAGPPRRPDHNHVADPGLISASIRGLARRARALHRRLMSPDVTKLWPRMMHRQLYLSPTSLR